ncbi:integral membrane sensor signal transduction histidine kinase [Pseudofrankia inefficax]|uniref:histidine kinase n=2 Tax=Pseudofrankia inefficax (strain DSM 45817 / CECT 9037 / DDB 130130 / EuI1c) TaxID=298654 RepID=E3J8J5_PSEI1|nr:integral membrane sensor signal transduction histidine kinase [Pseudofrankia inefficax]
MGPPDWPFPANRPTELEGVTMGPMESFGHWRRGRAGLTALAVRQDPPDVPGVVFGRMRHSRIGTALRAHPVLVDSTLALAVCVLALVPLALPPHGPEGAILLLTLAATAPLCLRRSYPLGTFVVCALVSLAQILLWVPSFGTFTSLLIEFYTVAKWCSRRATSAAAASVTAWILWFCVRLPQVRAVDRVGVALVFLPAAVAAGVLGVNANTRRAYVASITDRANRAERERDQQARLAAAGERSRIAREMHDIVAHNLSVMIALADGAGYTLRDLLGDAADPQDQRVRRATKAVESVSATGREALAQMRSLLGVLRDDGGLTQPADGGLGPDGALSGNWPAGDPGLDVVEQWGDAAGPGLDGGPRPDEPARAPQPRIADLNRLIEQVRHAGPTVGFLVTGQRRELPTDAELTVFRIVQESLTNVLKHTGPRANAVVRLGFDPSGVDIEITDTGSAPDDGSDRSVAEGPRSPGRGISGMRERAALHGGTLVAGPGAGGWRVAARIVAPAGPPPVAATGQAPEVPPARAVATPPGTEASRYSEGAPRP